MATKSPQNPRVTRSTTKVLERGGGTTDADPLRLETAFDHFASAALRKRIQGEKRAALDEMKTKAKVTGIEIPSKLPEGWTNEVVEACTQVLKQRSGLTVNQVPTPRMIPSDKDGNVANAEVGASAPFSQNEGGNVANTEAEVPDNLVASTVEDEAGHIRPGPLTNAQYRECADYSEETRLWIQRKAWEGNVDRSSVARALGLHNTEKRKTSLWNKHQVRFYSMETCQQSETVDDFRRRCCDVYSENTAEDKAKPLTDDEQAAVDLWRHELEVWWDDHVSNRISATISNGERYKVMLDLRKELCERAEWMSSRWQIEIIGFCVAAAADDPIARAASFAFAGSSQTRQWWDTRNVPTAQILADFETLCRGSELQSRESSGLFNMRGLDMEYKDRDKRTSKVKSHMVLLFNAAVGGSYKNFKWAEFPKHMMAAKKRLVGWPRDLPCPGGTEGLECLGHEGHRKLYLRFKTDENRPVDQRIHYEPWKDDEANLNPTDDAYGDVPIVIADNGAVLLRVKDAIQLKLSRTTKRKAKKESEVEQPVTCADDGNAAAGIATTKRARDSDDNSSSSPSRAVKKGTGKKKFKSSEFIDCSDLEHERNEPQTSAGSMTTATLPSVDQCAIDVDEELLRTKEQTGGGAQRKRSPSITVNGAPPVVDGNARNIPSIPSGVVMQNMYVPGHSLLPSCMSPMLNEPVASFPAISRPLSSASGPIGIFPSRPSSRLAHVPIAPSEPPSRPSSAGSQFGPLFPVSQQAYTQTTSRQPSPIYAQPYYFKSGGQLPQGYQPNMQIAWTGPGVIMEGKWQGDNLELGHGLDTVFE